MSLFSPDEIFERAADEGERRLDQSLLELVATSFIAGFTIEFGIVALGIVEGLVGSQSGHSGRIAGALAFGPGIVFLVVGRTELFNENFVDPTAAVVDRPVTSPLWQLVRLWTVTLAFNLLGGAVLGIVFTVEGVVGPAAATVLSEFAVERVTRGPVTVFASAIAGGALVSLGSYMLAALDGESSRIIVSYVVGFLLALGPFDHVVVVVLHVLLGFGFGATVALGELATLMSIVTAGNLVGGLGLVTFTHTAQVVGARERTE